MESLYQGFTLSDLKSMLDYDPSNGRFTSKKTGLPLVNNVYKVRNPQGSPVSVMLARVAVWFVEGIIVDPDSVVKPIDGDIYNLAYDNLVVVAKQDSNKPIHSFNAKETATKGVFYLDKYEYFVVRRGPTQAVYRTHSYKEAVAVRKEWEANPSIHRWDKFAVYQC